MISQQLVTGLHTKHYKSQFIHKLVDIMKKFPNLIGWSQNGKTLQLSNTSEIQTSVLPLYFRHSNLQSFLRQLNLYNFSQKKVKDKLVFQHNIFKRGKQHQFVHIQRMKNKKEKQQILNQLSNNDILKRIAQSPSLNQQQKQILNVIFSYKLIVLEKQKYLSKKLSKFKESIKSSRNKRTKQMQALLRQQIKKQLQQLKKFSESIDIFMNQTIDQRQKDTQEKLYNIRKSQTEKKYKQDNYQKNYKQPQLKLNSKFNENLKFQEKQKMENLNLQCSMPNYLPSSISQNNNFYDYKFYYPYQTQNPSIQCSMTNNLLLNHPHLLHNISANFNNLHVQTNFLDYPIQQSIRFMPSEFGYESMESGNFGFPLKNRNNYLNQNEKQKYITEQFQPKLQQLQTSGRTLTKERNDKFENEPQKRQENEISLMNNLPMELQNQ